MVVTDSLLELSCPWVNWGTKGAAMAELGSSKTSSQALVNFQLDLGGQDGGSPSIASRHGCLA